MAKVMSHGKVWLVGAGPGSADLITLRGLRCLQSADVVLHDALISPELLTFISPQADVFSVGKRGYCIGSTKQETIHDLLVRYARMGKTICRLKCGDPCIFGRGGEEAEALAEAGVAFEIVPGVTSALGAAASLNIPLTHRDVGQSITFATGHHAPDSEGCTLDWPGLARSPAVVFYMASRFINEIATKLLAEGMTPTTAVAIIENGTLPNQRVTISELALLSEKLSQITIQAPAIFLVGEVVRKSLFHVQHLEQSQ
jgi:uroporphyrin-III C-methyltransferase